MTRSLAGAIAAGGALGSMARLAASLAMAAMWPNMLVAGTLFANVAGSFLIGFIAIWSARRLPPPLLNGFLVTGFCGGFTTFSVFSFETLTLALEGQALGALAYVAVSVLGWLGAVALGWTVGALIFPPLR